MSFNLNRISYQVLSKWVISAHHKNKYRQRYSCDGMQSLNQDLILWRSLRITFLLSITIKYSWKSRKNDKSMWIWTNLFRNGLEQRIEINHTQSCAIFLMMLGIIQKEDRNTLILLNKISKHFHHKKMESIKQ